MLHHGHLSIKIPYVCLVQLVVDYRHTMVLVGGVYCIVSELEQGCHRYILRNQIYRKTRSSNDCVDVEQSICENASAISDCNIETSKLSVSLQDFKRWLVGVDFLAYHSVIRANIGKHPDISHYGFFLARYGYIQCMCTSRSGAPFDQVYRLQEINQFKGIRMVQIMNMEVKVTSNNQWMIVVFHQVFDKLQKFLKNHRYSQLVRPRWWGTIKYNQVSVAAKISNLLDRMISHTDPDFFCRDWAFKRPSLILFDVT